METGWLGDGVANNHKVRTNHKVCNSRNEILDFDERFGHEAGIGGKTEYIYSFYFITAWKETWETKHRWEKIMKQNTQEKSWNVNQNELV